jgi:hypothetical protein
LLIGCGVVLEIFRVALQRYPGTARMARNALLVVFALVLAKGFIAAAHDSRWWLEANTLQIEGILRTVQALAILALAAVFLLYSIPVARNLLGILLGYGTYVAVLAICLTFIPTVGHGFWFYAVPTAFLAALCVWLGFLWSFSEVPITEPSADELGNDYREVAVATRRRLQNARGQLGRAVRP